MGSYPKILLLTVVAASLPGPARACDSAGEQKKHAEEACEAFRKHPHFAPEDAGKATHAGCVAFYTEAVAARASICGYQENMGSLGAKKITAAEGVGASDDSQGAVAGLQKNAATMSRDFLTALQGHHEALKTKWQQYVHLLAKLGALAHATGAYEFRCDTTFANVKPSAAPGFFIKGLQEQAQRSGQETYESAVAQIRAAAGDARRLVEASNAASAEAGQNQAQAGAQKAGARLPRFFRPKVELDEGTHKRAGQRVVDIDWRPLVGLGASALSVAMLTGGGMYRVITMPVAHAANQHQARIEVLMAKYKVYAQAELQRDPSLGSRDLAKGFAAQIGNQYCR